MTITFIGGGNMAQALIGGMLQEGFDPATIGVVDVSAQTREKLRESYGVRVSEAVQADGLGQTVVLAVKPQQLREVAAALAPHLHEELVISIAAGIRAVDLSRWLGDYSNIVRVMPNTPAMVSEGISGLYALPGVDDGAREVAGKILSAVGKVVWVDDESHLDAVTALSGSGPAYVFYFLEAMVRAGTQLGLNSDQARVLAVETFRGAAKLAQQRPEPLETLRTQVTSKGGTTERALFSMNASGVGLSIESAVLAAAERSRELGDELGRAG